MTPLCLLPQRPIQHTIHAGHHCPVEQSPHSPSTLHTSSSTLVGVPRHPFWVSPFCVWARLCLADLSTLAHHPLPPCPPWPHRAHAFCPQQKVATGSLPSLPPYPPDHPHTYATFLLLSAARARQWVGCQKAAGGVVPTPTPLSHSPARLRGAAGAAPASRATMSPALLQPARSPESACCGRWWKL